MIFIEPTWPHGLGDITHPLRSRGSRLPTLDSFDLSISIQHMHLNLPRKTILPTLTEGSHFLNRSFTMSTSMIAPKDIPIRTREKLKPKRMTF